MAKSNGKAAKAPFPGKSAPRAAAVKRVYFFGNGKAEGNAGMKDLLGGKGANLADMTLVPLPVPPGFTITTDSCGDYNDAGRRSARWPDGRSSRQYPQGRKSHRQEASATPPIPCWLPPDRAPRCRCPA